MSHSTWRNKIKMWEIVTTVDKKERAIIVLLDALEGHIKAEKAVRDIRAEVLNTNKGMAVIFQKLDILFKNKTVDDANNAYSEMHHI